MAIGPEARRLASGRVVVAAGVLAVVGVAATVLGAGPLVEGASDMERGVGLVAMVLGGVMLVGAASLALRRGPARRLGVAGGIAAAILGALVTLAALLSLDRCEVEANLGCWTVLGGTVLVGVTIVVAGAASAAVVSRARPEALRRQRRR